MFRVTALLVFQTLFLFSAVSSQHVKINEVFKDGESFWVELYNLEDLPVDLDGYYFSFLPKIPFEFFVRLSDVRIEGKSLFVVELDRKASQHISHILLQDPSREYSLDTFSFGGVIGSGSYCRFPDGELWGEFLEPFPTPGEPNQLTSSRDRTYSLENNDFQIHVFNVGQGDSQLIIFPSGFSILIDVFESNWNSDNGAENIAQKIRDITGGSHVNVGVISHLHLDHLGYAGYGGFWSLIEEQGITFDKIIDRGSGKWEDENADNHCDPDTEIRWDIVGTYSGTATNWLCYATNPANEKIFNIREIAEFCSIDQIKPSDPDSFVQIVATNGIGAVMDDGITPVTGNYSSSTVPPSENDFSIGLLIGFGKFRYVTMGDLDGDYATSSYDYTYNNVEAVVAPRVGLVDVYHVNHHGSSHSSSSELLDVIQPSVSLISCGTDNSYGHPDQSVIDRLFEYGDIYLTSDCDLTRNYGTAQRLNKDIVVFSKNGEDYFIQGLHNTIEYKSVGKSIYPSEAQCKSIK